MRQGVTVADELGAMAQGDADGGYGVVGMDMSSQPTNDVITALAAAGLPVVAAPLSEDSLTVNNPMYFQVAPRNRREAAVAAQFARQRHVAVPPSDIVAPIPAALPASRRYWQAGATRCARAVASA